MNNEFLQVPTIPFTVGESTSVSELIDKMSGTSFQARNLAMGADIWSRMLQDDIAIFLGLAGAMVPSGMRKVIVYLIENRMIDCVVSTGANLFHDLHETLGKHHYKGSAVADDHALCQHGVDRIYDVYMSDDEFVDGETFMAEFTNTLDQSRPYTTREYLNLLGKRLITVGKSNGILTAAAKAGIPVYCPAIGDSALGIGMAKGRVQKGTRLYFDVIGDVVETTKIAYEAKTCGVVYIGGGTPKNFIQQAEVTTYIFGEILEGYKYAIQITMDSPQWGGLSGCTFEEAVSWGKEAPQARMVTINSDATIALPIIVSALAEKKIKRKSKPSFQLEGEFKVRAGRVRKSKK